MLGIKVYFRAFIGAVSLKLGGRRAWAGVPSDFRAFIGAVSLKHGDAGRGVGLPVPFPRLHRRGPIEAV